MNDTGSQSAGNPPSNTDIAWLAGIFDGEGCISMTMAPKKNGHFVQIIASIGNTDFAIIEQCADILKRAGVGRHVGHQSAGKNRVKDLKQLRVTGFKRIASFGELIMPYVVGVKKAQLQNALAFTYSRLLIPGRSGGKEKNHRPYTEREINFVNRAKVLRGSPNEYTQEWIDDVHKMYSGLRRQYEEMAEMTIRPQG